MGKFEQAGYANRTPCSIVAFSDLSACLQGRWILIDIDSTTHYQEGKVIVGFPIYQKNQPQPSELQF